ncbi:MAG TPA: wax ester/triacylglycerol synthase family O-acyltransferase [Candidatus Binatia bacterium]|nr:wax ester/triacylglycerol synthase family O-acyltransferase [Candidatus Binatia bacterium]
MNYSHAERLSALDVSFLDLEDGNAHMHIGAVAVFDAEPVSRPGGGVDIDRFRTLMEAGMHRLPRYRQKLATIPFFNHPVWVDDDRFNLSYHLRHTHLPVPGDERLLKRLAGRIMSQALDRGKPLWEMWVVEGLQGNRFAIITKVHHCMIDGVGSVELTGSVMRPTPDHDIRLDEPPPRWMPRPTPTPRALVAGEMLRRVLEPVGAVAALPRAVRDPRSATDALVGSALGIGEALATGLRPASPTPLNVDIGPHRRFDWTSMDIATVKQIRQKLGGTLNDIVLAIVAGGLRKFLRRRGLGVERLDFRAMVPVNVRTQAERESMGNRVAMMVARLPLDARDPGERLSRVIRETTVLKHSRQAAGIQTLEELSDHTFTTLFTLFGRLAAGSRPFNLVVTNVPGPAFPVYIEGARMLACHPLVPLYRNQALGIALFSYDGRLWWGFNADWDALPDLHDLVEAVAGELPALARVAGLTPTLEVVPSMNGTAAVGAG